MLFVSKITLICPLDFQGKGTCLSSIFLGPLSVGRVLLFKVPKPEKEEGNP